MKLIKTLFLSIAMLMMTSVSASDYEPWQVYWEDRGYFTVDGVQYKLYFITEYLSMWDANLKSERRVASVIAFPKGVEEVTIPKTVTKDNVDYNVSYLGWELSGDGPSSGYSKERFSSLYSSSLRVLTFESSITMASDRDNAYLSCLNLTDLYFNGGLPSPTLTQYSYKYDRYFTAPRGTVTLHVKGSTKEQLAALKTQAPWDGFKDILGGTASTSLTLFAGEGGGRDIEVWGDDEKIVSVPQWGGSVWNQDIVNKEYIELRIPSTYLEKIIINGEDVTETLPATTPTDPAYQGYTFYTMYDFPKQMTVEVKYNVPEQTSEDHQPEIMIMRSGEGNILFKGLCKPDPQAVEAYEHQFGYPADEYGIVVSAVSNCPATVTTVTVPKYDYLGGGESVEFDPEDWGFRAEITPVAGQTLKTLLVGYIKDETIHWEDLLYGEDYGMYVHPEYIYVNHNESTNTYTLNWGFDEMNVWIGDYIVNIAMGPEETAVETGATLNFVRQGGRTEVLFEKEDADGTLSNQVIGEGSKSFNLKYFTVAELDDAGMGYYQLLSFHPVEGENIRVFCDGTDITSQLIYNSETGNARLELERKNHTYTILIEDAPDANPTWTVMQNGGMTGTQVVVTRNGEDETTAVGGSVVTLPIDDEGVEKVTLKVPVGSSVPVTKYQIRLESIAYGTGTLIVNNLMELCNMDRPTANALVESLPGFIPIYYDSEADAQPIVDVLTSRNAVVEIVPVTSGTQAIANNTPIRVMRNGEEVTFQMDFSDPLYAAYEVPVASLTDETWEVSYDTNHRQTFIRKGGTRTSNVEVEFDYPVDDNENYFYPDKIGTPLYVDFPTYHPDMAPNAYVYVAVEDGSTFTVLRNGVDVTNKFTPYAAASGFKGYLLSEADNGDSDTQAALGFQFRDPAVWEITIGDTDRYDVNGDGSISIADVTKLVNKILGKE